MESTTRNMWKLIYDRKCGAVVMLSNLVENGMVRQNVESRLCNETSDKGHSDRR